MVPLFAHSSGIRHTSRQNGISHCPCQMNANYFVNRKIESSENMFSLSNGFLSFLIVTRRFIQGFQRHSKDQRESYSAMLGLSHTLRCWADLELRDTRNCRCAHFAILYIIENGSNSCLFAPSLLGRPFCFIQTGRHITCREQMGF